MASIVRRITLWRKGDTGEFSIEVGRGRLAEMRLTQGRAAITDGIGRPASEEPIRLHLTITEARVAPGSEATLVAVRGDSGFSFFLRDVDRRFPIYLPDAGIAVTEAEDERTYNEIESAVRGAGQVGSYDRIERDPEETFETAAGGTRNLRAMILQGLARDARKFYFGFRDEGQDAGEPHGIIQRWDFIQPVLHHRFFKLEETKDRNHRLDFMIGRGYGCTHRITRRLDQGVLPILNATVADGEIEYRVTSFASLECSDLTAENLVGSDWNDVADADGETILRSKLIR